LTRPQSYAKYLRTPIAGRILQDLLNEWVAGNVASEVDDFIYILKKIRDFLKICQAIITKHKYCVKTSCHLSHNDLQRVGIK
jgi:hypothetical protein